MPKFTYLNSLLKCSLGCVNVSSPYGSALNNSRHLFLCVPNLIVTLTFVSLNQESFKSLFLEVICLSSALFPAGLSFL